MSATPRPAAALADVDQLLTGDPYRAYAALRATGRAAVRHEATRSWYVTDPAYLREMLTDRRFVARGASPLEPALLGVDGAEVVERIEAFLGLWPVFSDAPAQRAASGALRRYFSRTRAEQLRPALRVAFEEIAGRADGRRPVATFARPVSEVMLALLLRLPPEEIDRLRAMTAPTIAYLSNDGQDIGMAGTALDRIENLKEWLAGRSSSGEDWLIDELTEAGVELSLDELAALYMQLVTGALDPTSHALVGALRLLRGSTEARRLAEEGNFAGLVELCLGNDTGFHFAPRRSRCPIAFHGEQIGAGERVVGVLASAAAVEAQARAMTGGAHEERAGTSLAFGHGRHFCLGAGIAQVTLEEALRSIHRLRDLAELDLDEVERLPALGASIYRDPAPAG